MHYLALVIDTDREEGVAGCIIAGCVAQGNQHCGGMRSKRYCESYGEEVGQHVEKRLTTTLQVLVCRFKTVQFHSHMEAAELQIANYKWG